MKKDNKKIENLANDILENSGIYRKYTDMDLANTVMIFSEVFLTKMYDKHKDKLDQKHLEELAQEAGKSLRQTVKLFTGVDLHKVFKN